MLSSLIFIADEKSCGYAVMRGEGADRLEFGVRVPLELVLILGDQLRRAVHALGGLSQTLASILAQFADALSEGLFHALDVLAQACIVKTAS